MVKEVLIRAGFKENKTFKETRFLKPPRSTYAVYMDSFERRGADNMNLLTEHDCTIELYAYAPDPEAEKRLEKALDDFGIAFTKQERYWHNEEQLYQTIYEFNYIEK